MQYSNMTTIAAPSVLLYIGLRPMISLPSNPHVSWPAHVARAARSVNATARLDIATAVVEFA